MVRRMYHVRLEDKIFTVKLKNRLQVNTMKEYLQQKIGMVWLSRDNVYQ